MDSRGSTPDYPVLVAELRRIDQRFEDYRESQAREQALLKEQLAEYKSANATKLAEMNEVRRQIYEERGQYQLREKADAILNEIMGRINRVETGTSALAGRLIGMGLALAFFTTLLGLALRFWGK